MKLCNDTITVYNHGLDADGYDVYYPTVIKGVHWHCEVASTVTNDGLKTANQYTIRIPLDADFSGKTYAPPEIYQPTVLLFTLAQGDLIVKGIGGDIEDPGELKGRVTIVGVTDNTSAPNAPHWKVVGA